MGIIKVNHNHKMASQYIYLPVGSIQPLDLKCSHALLLAGDYAESFVSTSEFVKMGGKFIIPLPQPSMSALMRAGI